jgi:hypothetical protein
MSCKTIFKGLFGSLIFMLISCFEDQWRPPEQLTEAFVRPSMDRIMSIHDLFGLYEQQIALDGNPILDLNTHAHKFLEGIVISSDSWGNYYKELVIQNRPEEPQVGLRILVDQTSLSDLLAPGHHIYISLEGLDLGPDQQMLTLGIEDGGRIRALSLDQEFGSKILRDTLMTSLVPKIVALETLDPKDMNQWIKIEDIQFHRSLVMGPQIASFAAGIDDRYDGNRLIESCSGGTQLLLQTSVFADFQTQKLPQGRGYIQGILQYDYYGAYPVLVVNNSDDLVMDSPQRCDPDVLVCLEPNNALRLIERFDFEQVNDLQDLTESGWTVTTNSNDPIWEFGTYSGNRYLLIDGRDSPSDSLKTKLISPMIDFPAQTEELTLELDLQVNFAQGIPLSLYIGQVQGDEIIWSLLDYIMPTGPANTYGDFQTLGPISLSCVAPPIVLGLSYEQLSEYDRTRYHIDNIEFRVWP